MPIVIDATVGGANANAYGAVAVIDAHALGTAWATAWAAKTADEKNALAVRATRALDGRPFAGWPVSTTQALQFPRDGVYRPDGSAWANDLIPPPIVTAWAHIAAWLSSFAATVDPFSLASASNVRRKKIGPLETEYFAPRDRDGDAFLTHVIDPMLRPWGLVGASGSVRLLR